MNSIFPIITVSDLQKSTKKALENVKDYAVIRSHSTDVGVVLTPELGRALLDSDMFRQLLEHVKKDRKKRSPKADMNRLDKLIGNVLLELSKR